jgi:hypothetical protein
VGRADVRADDVSPNNFFGERSRSYGVDERNGLLGCVVYPRPSLYLLSRPVSHAPSVRFRGEANLWLRS